MIPKVNGYESSGGRFTAQSKEKLFAAVKFLSDGKLGGEEAPLDQWRLRPKRRAKMKEPGLENERGLRAYFND